MVDYSLNYAIEAHSNYKGIFSLDSSYDCFQVISNPDRQWGVFVSCGQCSLRYPAQMYSLQIQHYTMHSVRAVFVGSVSRQRLSINFLVSRVNFLTTLRSHLNVSCYFWSNLLNVDVNYSYILGFYL